MADKAVSELVPAEVITATDLFVLEQNGTAKKLPGQVLLNWLTAAADGHGGISKIEKLKTSGLADTYRITLADTTTFDFAVNNGKGISNIAKTSTSGLVDTYTITYNDGAKTTFTVTNGAKGDKGDNTYVWVKYASQEPTASSSSFGDLPDDWIGIYYGGSNTAPTDWQQYKWFKIIGEKGDTGAPATLIRASVSYQVSDSGTIIPSGNWSSTIPVVAQGKYLWTRIAQTFNTGEPVTAYTISRMGLDGLGSVVSVANISPDLNGNVRLTPEDIGALSVKGGNMEGSINMQGQSLTGMNEPTDNAEAANKGYVDKTASKAGSPYNYLDNSDFTNPVNQRGSSSYDATSSKYWLDRWLFYGSDTTFGVSDKKLTGVNAGASTCGFYQRILAERLTVGKKYTLAIKAKVTGTWYLCYGDNTSTYYENSGELVQNTDTIHVFSFTLPESSDGQYHFRLRTPANAATIEAEWIALYEGEYTADNLPAYNPKGYAHELLECQRYFFNASGYTAWTGYKSSTLYGFIAIPAQMRITPSVTATAIEVRGAAEAGESAATATIGVIGYGTFGNHIRLTLNASDVSNYQPTVVITQGLEVSADL